MITYVGSMSFPEEAVQAVKVTTKRSAAAKAESRFQPSRAAARRSAWRHTDRAQVTS
ncbi:hypothetical protein [Variovorax saccharolyticus]|uniref:hypothetical protein n=1 Tax=Variovorax saccharolyticus TaxID=3053516 RepID=UPI0025764BEB|nr:hypothetical protein [Variovorax sp. J31P216]MDM0028241.1 hypothetical protein [Variovorax sp. J31P216]